MYGLAKPSSYDAQLDAGFTMAYMSLGIEE
jgi:hypothetical protein